MESDFINLTNFPMFNHLQIQLFVFSVHQTIKLYHLQGNRLHKFWDWHYQSRCGSIRISHWFCPLKQWCISMLNNSVRLYGQLGKLGKPAISMSCHTCTAQIWSLRRYQIYYYIYIHTYLYTHAYIKHTHIVTESMALWSYVFTLKRLTVLY